jgi:hypothetical protein
MDVNFMIPELVNTLAYRKGPYYADEGNFSAAGAVHIDYRQQLAQPFVTLSGGENGYYRTVAAASPGVGDGNLLLAGEYAHNDGPWENPENFGKFAGVAKYSVAHDTSQWSLAGMAYDGEWDSSDQVPQRAVSSGLISRFGTIDSTTGGDTHRYSLSGQGSTKIGDGRLRANAYVVDYSLDLISNFTYATDPVRGDQFEQFEDRLYYGGSVEWEQPLALLGRKGNFSAGVQLRYDDIQPVALYRTQARKRWDTVREDDVTQWSYGLYASQELRWTPWLRSELGLRHDQFHFDVESSLPLNSGTADDSITSPKLTLVFGPWARTEYFVNAGRGFHSNDARGTTIRVDPSDGVTPAEKVSPLVAATGYEVGLRTAAIPRVQLAAALWHLDLDSELVFSGDGGTTEPSRASERQGLEIGIYCSPLDWLVIDADAAWTHARYTDADPAGNRIPNAVESVASVGLTANRDRGWFGGARLRYFGPAPLIEDNSARSDSTLVVNLEAGYHVTPNFRVTGTLFNLFDSQDNDITYFYESQLPGETVPVADYHFHPVEPRTARLSLTVGF